MGKGRGEARKETSTATGGGLNSGDMKGPVSAAKATLSCGSRGHVCTCVCVCVCRACLAGKGRGSLCVCVKERGFWAKVGVG